MWEDHGFLIVTFDPNMMWVENIFFGFSLSSRLEFECRFVYRIDIPIRLEPKLLNS